jgi:uncharacterized protein
MSVNDPLMIWRMFDGRAGHRNQVLGLTEAIADRHAVTFQDIELGDIGLRGARCLIPGRLGPLRKLPAPDLLVAAGHGTHLPLLLARRKFGGRAVVLMKPSLPLSWFDLCLVPRADGLRSLPPHVMETEGALNRIRPSDRLHAHRGLLLIGGPSAHFGWDDQFVLSQVARILHNSSAMRWTATTSRRTPASFQAAWQRAGLDCPLTPVEETTPDWLPRQLQHAGQVWVTSDSVSMIYEALSSGSAVGVLDLPDPRMTRVSRGVADLIERRFVRRLNPGDKLPGASQQPPLQESSRCAEALLKHFGFAAQTIRRAA